jgi:hypothetical protein
MHTDEIQTSQRQRDTDKADTKLTGRTIFSLETALEKINDVRDVTRRVVIQPSLSPKRQTPGWYQVKEKLKY